MGACLDGECSPACQRSTVPRNLSVCTQKQLPSQAVSGAIFLRRACALADARRRPIRPVRPLGIAARAAVEAMA